MLAHAAPFIAWLLLMILPWGAAAWMYALRSVVGAALLLALRPWRWYAPPSLRHVPLALGCGGVVFVAWVIGETPWFERTFPALQEAYLRFGSDFRRFGQLPTALPATPFAPGTCGWPLAGVRLLGSGLVIAPIEEFFWRGFVYRALIAQPFVRVDPGRFRLWPFIVTTALFALEHDRWLAGAVAGMAYGLLMIRTRDIWAAAIAHSVTNLLLGAYVLSTGAYGFW